MQSKDKRQFKNKAMKFNIQDYAEGNRACVCQMGYYYFVCNDF